MNKSMLLSSHWIFTLNKLYNCYLSSTDWLRTCKPWNASSTISLSRKIHGNLLLKYFNFIQFVHSVVQTTVFGPLINLCQICIAGTNETEKKNQTRLIIIESQQFSAGRVLNFSFFTLIYLEEIRFYFIPRRRDSLNLCFSYARIQFWILYLFIQPVTYP